MCLGSGTSLRLRAHFKSRLTRVQRQVAKIQESQPGQGRPSKVCAQSDLRCAPLEKSPSARPAAAVAQQTTSRRLRRRWGQTSPEGGAVLEIRRGRPNAGERSAAMTGLVLRPGAGDGCVSLEMRHRLDASPRAERRKWRVGRTSRNLERGTVARFDVNGVDSGDAVCTLPTQLTRVS